MDVLISIKPEWVQKIISGEKTIELRKSFPKQVTPFRCFIYVTKGFKPNRPYSAKLRESRGKIIGEFVCDLIYLVTPIPAVAEAFSGVSCVSAESIMNYGGNKMVYGWRISDLKIYDEPRPLSDFYLDRAPQSWCYIPNQKMFHTYHFSR